MITWWLQSSSGADQGRQVKMGTDMLAIPHSADFLSHQSGDSSPLTGNLIQRTSSAQMIRTRSNSIKSYNSSDIKSSYVFRRADSFRHKLKSESLCQPPVRQLPEKNTAAAVYDDTSSFDEINANPVTIQIEEVN